MNVEEPTSESSSSPSSHSLPAGKLNRQRKDKSNKSFKKLRIVTPNISAQKDQKKAHPNGSYQKNRICTSKYNCLLFIPQNLSEQFFGRFANMYFLSIQIINFLPGLFSFLLFSRFAKCFSFFRHASFQQRGPADAVFVCFRGDDD